MLFSCGFNEAGVRLARFHAVLAAHVRADALLQVGRADARAGRIVQHAHVVAVERRRVTLDDGLATLLDATQLLVHARDVLVAHVLGQRDLEFRHGRAALERVIGDHADRLLLQDAAQLLGHDRELGLVVDVQHEARVVVLAPAAHLRDELALDAHAGQHLGHQLLHDVQAHALFLVVVHGVPLGLGLGVGRVRRHLEVAAGRRLFGRPLPFLTHGFRFGPLG